MSNYIRFKDSVNFINTNANAAQTSSLHSCIGHNICRFQAVSVGLTDAGGIDQTVILHGSIDGVNFSAALATLTFASAAEVIFSAAIDVRGYAHLKLVYDKKGATAGTITARLISHV